MPGLLKVTTSAGKYEITQRTEGDMTFRRHNEVWEAANRDLAHTGLILVLAQDLDRCRRLIARLDARRKRRMDTATWHEPVDGVPVERLIEAEVRRLEADDAALQKSEGPIGSNSPEGAKP